MVEIDTSLHALLRQVIQLHVHVYIIHNSTHTIAYPPITKSIEFGSIRSVVESSHVAVYVYIN